MSASQSGTKQILIVDDDPAIREILAELLAEEGYAVATAKHGQDALQKLHDDSRYCLILLDLMMPVMDGWASRRRQRLDPVLTDIPVIVFSGADNLAQQAAELAIDDFLEKPVDAEQLLAVISRLCDSATHSGAAHALPHHQTNPPCGQSAS
ncbi:MAG: response regulator [Candidatus Sericytochromatia bacterium]|nr:response regulator [Candidatus Sericytochromatia bacterium]